MHKTKTLGTLLVALLLGLVSQNVLAQENNLARMYYMDAKTGMEAGLETALKQHAEWRKEQGDPWTWTVLQVVNGEHLGRFMARSGNHAWGDFDAYDTGFGPKADIHFNATVAPLIESASSAITSVDTTNVNWHPNNDAVNLISVTTFHLKPGQGEAFTQAINKLHTAIVEHNYPAYHAFEWNVNGAAGQAVSLILPYENWAAMEGPEEPFFAFMARVMGPEEIQKTFAAIDDTYHKQESFVLLQRRDLSVLPAMQGNQ